MQDPLQTNQPLSAASVFGFLMLVSSPTFAESNTARGSDAERSSNTAQFADPGKTGPGLTKVTSEANRAVARTHAIAGFRALDAKAYTEAVSQFTKALELLEAPTLRVGRADALVELNRWQAAQDDYRAAAAYVTQPGDSAALVASRAEATKKLQSLAARTPRLRVEANAARVEVLVDDKPAQSLIPGATLDLDPGPHTIRVTAGDQSLTHSVNARPDAEHVVEGPRAPTVSQIPSSQPATDLDREASSPLSDEVLVSGTISGVLTVGAIVTGLLFLNNYSRYNDVREDPSASESRVDELYQSTQTLQWVNTGLTAAAIVGAGVTTYFWLAPRSDGARINTAGSSAFSAPHGLLLGASGSF